MHVTAGQISTDIFLIIINPLGGETLMYTYLNYLDELTNKNSLARSVFILDLDFTVWDRD